VYISGAVQIAILSFPSVMNLVLKVYLLIALMPPSQQHLNEDKMH